MNPPACGRAPAGALSRELLLLNAGRGRRVSLLRLADFCGAPRRPLAKTGALPRVAVAQICSAGRSPLAYLDGCPCSASAVSAAGSASVCLPPGPAGPPPYGGSELFASPLPRRSSFWFRAPVKGRRCSRGVTAVGGRLRSRSAACGKMQRGGAGAAVCFLQAGHVPRRKSRAPQPGLGKIIPRIERQSLRHPIRRETSRLYRSLRSPQDVSRLRTAGAGLRSEQRFKGR